MSRDFLKNSIWTFYLAPREGGRAASSASPLTGPATASPGLGVTRGGSRTSDPAARLPKPDTGRGVAGPQAQGLRQAPLAREGDRAPGSVPGAALPGPEAALPGAAHLAPAPRARAAPAYGGRQGPARRPGAPHSHRAAAPGRTRSAAAPTTLARPPAGTTAELPRGRETRTHRGKGTGVEVYTEGFTRGREAPALARGPLPRWPPRVRRAAGGGAEDAEVLQGRDRGR